MSNFGWRLTFAVCVCVCVLDDGTANDDEDSIMEEDTSAHVQPVTRVITADDVSHCQRVYFDVETTGLGMY